MIRKIAVLTSGGDAPGMNAAIRAVVRRAIYEGLDVYGIKHGYDGLLDQEFMPMELGSVGGIIHRGGTFLYTARCERFLQPSFRLQAAENLKQEDIDGLVVIGGDGSFAGAASLQKETGINVVGVPATIDNDIAGTDRTIGFDTAVDNVLECINKLRDTAMSHERIFLIEVMGRKSGAIALESGLAGGAESILIPEIPFSLSDICGKLMKCFYRGKRHSIIVVAEGAGSVQILSSQIREKTGLETKVVVLGYLQRGGTPNGTDRLLGSRLGAKAVEMLIQGHSGRFASIQNDLLTECDLTYPQHHRKTIDFATYELADILSL